MLEVLKQALEALYPISHNSTDDYRGQADKAITSLRQAIAELESQEPVAWVQDVEFEQLPEFAFSWGKTRLHDKPLYTHPPQRTWVGLTDDDMASMSMVGQYKTLKEWFLAIEAKLKEKNNA